MFRALLFTIPLLLLGSSGSYALDSCVVPDTETYFVNEHSECREVTNATGSDIMVPTKTAAEWATGGMSFIDNTPTGVSLVACATTGPCNVSGLTQVGTVTDAGMNGARGVAVSGNYAYVVSNGSDSLTVIDISTPSSPSIVGSISNTNLNGAWAVDVDGNYAYVTSFNADRFTIIDVSDPANPTQTSSITSTNLEQAYDVKIVGNYAYVVSDIGQRMNIINVTNKSSPSIIGSISNANLNRARAIDVVSNYAYVASATADSLTIINVTNKSSPSQVGTISTTDLNAASGVTVSGNYAYVASRDARSLTIIDISNPSSPSQVGTVSDFTQLGDAEDVVVSGDFAYVATERDYITVVDVSDPANPTIVDSLTNTDLDGAWNIFNVGDYFYVASRFADSLTIIEPTCASPYTSCTEKPPSTPFIVKYDSTLGGDGTSNSQVLVVAGTGIFNYDISWEDSLGATGSASGLTDDYTINGVAPGEVTVTISGTFPHFNGDATDHGIIDVVQWGSQPWETMNGTFSNETNLTGFSATDTPNLSNVTDISYMFSNTPFNHDISGWDTSNITDMSWVFGSAQTFNQDISGWDTSNVTNMQAMFFGAHTFNQDISGWDTSNVNDMASMFAFAYAFNQDINAWDTSNVNDMFSMFGHAYAFNQNLSGWCVTNIPSKPSNFDNFAGAWAGGAATRPQWGTCP